MLKVIETKEEFLSAAAAGMLWANYEDAGWRQAPWERLGPSFLRNIWDTAEGNSRKASPNMHEWQLHDFAILVEDDGEGDG
jgi:hypothetical protein